MHDIGELSDEERMGFSYRGHAWQMAFLDASPDLRIRAGMAEPQRYHFFLGNDPAQWGTDATAHEELVYENVWPGVDMRCHGDQGGFKYDLLLDGGVDPWSIGFAYEGLEGMSVDVGGRLILRTSVGDVMESSPVAWYADGAHEPVDCRYHLEGKVLRFRFGKGTDHGRPIVIDPLLIASTLSGATGASNYGHCATFDAAGNIYTAARSFGAGYPVTPGAFQMTFGVGGTDISISKYNPDGSQLIWASYLGGSGTENPHSLIVTANQQLCVFGTTASSNFPTTTGAYDNTLNGQDDITVTVFAANGNFLVGSTYVGGSAIDGINAMGGNYGEGYRGEIILDGASNICIASCTRSSNFPVTAGVAQSVFGGAQDGVLFSMDLSCSNLLWSTFIGGSSNDNAMGLRAESSGEVLVTGATESANFPMLATGYQTVFLGLPRDGYVHRYAAGAASIVNSTFLATTGSDRPYFLDTDNQGDVWIYGQTEGVMPISPAGTFGTPGGDIFISQLDPTLSTMLVTTTIEATGGFGTSLAPVAFLIDVCDHIYISGYNSGSGLPTTPNFLYSSGSFYLAAFDVDMSGLLFGTYYGGSHVDGGTSRFDKDGIIYQGVCSGTGSMQTTPWAHATGQTIGWDIGVFKIDFQVAGVNAAGAGTLNQGCAPIQIDFLNTSTGDLWVWDFGDGSPVDSTYQPSHTYTAPGSYTVTLIAQDSLSCNLADTIQFPITIGQAQPLTASFTYLQDSDCLLNELQTENTSTGTPLAFDWDMGDGTLYADTNVVHNYTSPGTYDVQLIAYDPTGCSQPDTAVQSITILPPDSVHALFTIDQMPDCSDLIVSTQNSSVGPAPSYGWNMGDGTLLSGIDVSHTYSTVGQYTVTLIATDSLTCNIADTVALQVTVDPTEPVVADFTIDQVFDCAQLLAATSNLSTGTFMGFAWDMGDGTLYADTNVTHTYAAPGTYDITLVVSDLLGCSPSDTAYAQVIVEPLIPVVADFTLEQVGNCTLLNVASVNNSTGDLIGFSWDMGDGTLYTDTNVTHTYTSPGTYTVVLTVTDLACGQNDQLSVPVVVINDLPTPLVPNAILCLDQSIVLDATSNVDMYLWSTGETTPSITVSAGGTYIVDVFTSTCTGSDTVEVVAAVEMDLSYSFDACPNSSNTLTVPYDGTAYLWGTGGTEQSEVVVGTGAFGFTVWDDLGCPHLDTVSITPLDPDARLFAPNAFTPNGDGVNDRFFITGYGAVDVELDIFNRWGQALYSVTTLDLGWDGTYNGEPVEQEVYVYRLRYTSFCPDGGTTEVLGHVTVVR